jgi:phosphatidylinositol-binding clathrin assembly protein
VKFFLGDLSNDITLTAFRLLVSDLLALFQPLNEGVMNVLGTSPAHHLLYHPFTFWPILLIPGHYFEMSRTDAERSLRIYKTFVERTNEVIEYLSEAKALEHAMRLQIPNVKHVRPPTPQSVFPGMSSLVMSVMDIDNRLPLD